MGTRSDYYVGTGEGAEWLGSLAFDGWPDGIEPKILAATTESDFRREVTHFLAPRDDCTLPAQGWPWPWNDSRTTDFAYCFDGERVRVYCFGHHWPNQQEPEEDYDHLPQSEFPDMAARKRVTYGRRSGLLVIGPEGLVDMDAKEAQTQDD